MRELFSRVRKVIASQIPSGRVINTLKIIQNIKRKSCGCRFELLSPQQEGSCAALDEVSLPSYPRTWSMRLRNVAPMPVDGIEGSDVLFLGDGGCWVAGFPSSKAVSDGTMPYVCEVLRSIRTSSMLAHWFQECHKLHVSPLALAEFAGSVFTSSLGEDPLICLANLFWFNHLLYTANVEAALEKQRSGPDSRVSSTSSRLRWFRGRI